MREVDDVTGQIINAAIRIHRGMGPGLLESVYERVLAAQLSRHGLKVERQKVVEFEFDGIRFDRGFRLDLMVDEIVAVEVKSVERLKLIHRTQLLTYLRLMRLPVGLLINFGGLTLREGLVRLVNKLPPSSSRLLAVDRAMPTSEADR